MNHVPPGIHYDRIILHLRGSGLSQREIARHLGVRDSTLSRLVTYGGEPRLSTALRLLDLHYDRCPTLHRADVIGVPK
jgi:transcriptional regulator with XRE-family HTH domain